MGLRILVSMCVISAGCGGGFHTGLPTPSIPRLPASAGLDTGAGAVGAIVEIEIQPAAVVAASTGAPAIQPGPAVEDDDVRFAESANPLALRDVDLETTGQTREIEVPAYPPTTWQPDVTYDSAAVYTKIVGTYQWGLQRCFAPVADGREDPGKLSVSFTIGEAGRVIAARAVGLTAEMAACAEQRALGWRFAAPYDDIGDPSEVTVTISFVIAR